MNNPPLLVALARGTLVTDEALASALYEVCDREHSSCNDECPVYELNGHKPVNAHRPFEENRGCDCFKCGAAMLAFIRAHVS